MSFISESYVQDKAENVGGKGAHLQKLILWKAPVAPFFVLTTETFKFYIKNNSLPDEVTKRFEKFFDQHPKIALRSSMISEDNVDSSFAGLFETLLYVTKENWKTSLIKIYSSVKSDRVVEYIEKKKLKVDLQMAVVAQELIEVEKSGVIFTRSPVFPTSAIAIDAAFGMGEGVVSGHADVDHYQFTRTKDLILSRSQNHKPVLTEDEQSQLIDLSLAMEKMIGIPSDIEWGIKKSKLYLFQIRPITRTFDPLTYFVDTNLSESYPGTVSPFTASFVQKAYENVFRESAEIMGAKGKRLEILSGHYAKLISSVDNHLYYNLEHYYAALRSLPGGEKNIDNWHKMIGGRITGQDIPVHKTELSFSENLFTLFSLLNLAFKRKKKFEPFLKNLEVLRTEIETETKNIKTSKEAILFLGSLVDRPLGFGLTVVNDIFIMLGLGILTKALKKKGIDEDRVIDLLKTSDGVDSVKPLEHFNELVKSLSHGFVEAFSKENLVIGFNPFDEVFVNLESKGWTKDVESLKAFLKNYGDRSFEELKLESLPMRNNPILVKELLIWASKNPSLYKETVKKEQTLELGWFLKKVINFTRESIAMREATRLWRGKFYHLLRQAVLNVGEKLKSEDQSWNQFQILDLFSINHHEWKAYAQGKLTKEKIQTLMNERKLWQTKKQHYPEIIPWVASEALPDMNLVVSSGALEGQGVSPGIAEGIALVLENPNDALSSDFTNFILVTKNTDPAWVYIMSRSQGLISEKGSLLSHTAIIGRELNIPTIVGVKMATQKIKNGERIRIDATKGTIEIL
jgi:phosphohistidine swiveling domain-containing protein